MSINALANAAVARRSDMQPAGRAPRGLDEIARAAAATPQALPAGGPIAREPAPLPGRGGSDPHDAAGNTGTGTDAGAGGNTSTRATAGTGVAADTDTDASTADRNPRNVETALNVLFGYIPTEVVTLYVAVLAAIGKEGVVTPGEWIAFWCFLGATPLVVWLVYAAKVKAAGRALPLLPSAWPLWEMAAATLAYLAWAFALPRNPFTDFGWYSPALAAVGVLIVSALLGLVAPLFQRPIEA